MKIKTQFIHHDYASDPAVGFYELVKPDPSDFENSVDVNESLSAAQEQFFKSGIERIILVHGTMVGTDSLGWYGHWGLSLIHISEPTRPY